MTLSLIFSMIIASLAAILLYTLIGFVPGTDETSVLMPVTLALVLAGTPPMVVLAFFMAAIVTLNLMNAIPTALVGLPGGVMSTPMIEHALFLKEKGLAATSIKKMATGSLLGTLVAVPTSLLLGNLLAPLAENIKSYSAWLFILGAIFLALIGKNKILALLSMVPLALLFQGLRSIYWDLGVVPQEKNITISFFLGITIGPLIISLLQLLNKKMNQDRPRYAIREVVVSTVSEKENLFHPLQTLTKKEGLHALVTSLIANFLFVLSPVGLTILLGEASSKQAKEPIERAELAVTTMSALSHATYLSGVIIPLIALGIPLSPVAVGPANALFNAPPVFTLDHNLHHILTTQQFVVAILIGTVLASIVTYYIAMRYAAKITVFVLQKIPHEAILGIFVAFILLLAVMDGGLLNIFGVLLVGIVCGTLNQLGVNYGVQFMILYAAPELLKLLVF